jgi:hypothetical protein
MDVGRDSLIAGCVLAIVVLAFPLNTRAGSQEHDKPSAVARGGRWRGEVPDPVANRVTRDALDGAWALFAGAAVDVTAPVVVLGVQDPSTVARDCDTRKAIEPQTSRQLPGVYPPNRRAPRAAVS